MCVPLYKEGLPRLQTGAQTAESPSVPGTRIKMAWADGKVW